MLKPTIVMSCATPVVFLVTVPGVTVLKANPAGKVTIRVWLVWLASKLVASVSIREKVTVL